MAKKVFEANLKKRHIDTQRLKQQAEEFAADLVTRNKLDEFTESPNPETGIMVVEAIKQDSNLNPKQKGILLSAFEEKYLELFNFDNCPDDYESLKIEAKFLAKMSQNSFLLMAQRLQKIKDNELWKLDKNSQNEQKYLSFKDFIVNEIHIERTTAYKYIDLISLFGVETFQHGEIEHSKLLPIIPLLKSNIEESMRVQIISQILSDAKEKSAREMQKEAKALKLKYGIVPLKKEISSVEKIKRDILKTLKKSELQEIKNFIDELLTQE